MITYVSTYSCGYGDILYYGNLYAGNDYEAAKKVLLDFGFPSENNQWGIVEYWENGKITKWDLVRE